MQLITADLKPDNIYVKFPNEPGRDDAISAYIAAHPPETYPPINIPADIALEGVTSTTVWRSQPLPDLGSTPLEERAIVIGDFGEAVPASEDQEWMAQPEPYRAPEVILGCPWSKPVDIWSLGCLTYEWLAHDGIVPPMDDLVDFQGPMELTTAHLVLDAIERMRGEDAFPPAFLARCTLRDEYFDKSDGALHVGTNLPSATIAERLAERDVSPAEIGGAAAFIERCLAVDPQTRPTAAELLQDPWLSDVE